MVVVVVVEGVEAAVVVVAAAEVPYIVDIITFVFFKCLISVFYFVFLFLIDILL